MNIRPATLSDVNALTTLDKVALGYTASEQVTRQALSRILQQQDILLVAEHDNNVVGYVHATPYQTLYFTPLLNVLGLAVLPEAQHLGIGKQLMSQLEIAAQSEGYAGIRLNSSTKRTNAHQFYEHLGYVCDKEQKRFFKKL
ncbi:MAG TPA: GNAT family N-acetyltransferase [Lactobacillus sp.]|nr:GNAT family N-acetyltransferase [Lactobacillus sp.]